MSLVGMEKVLVTGGGTGIGRAVAEALLAKGGRVVVVGRRADPLQALAERFPGRVFPLSRDLSVQGEREGLLALARDLLGGLDGLVYAAGVVSHQPPGTVDEPSLRMQLEVNLVAPFRLGEEALEVLAPGGGVVFVASNLAHRPLVTSALYSASKAGLLAAMRSLALAGAPRGIRFNAVSPGIVDTDMVRTIRLLPGEGPLGEEEAQLRLEGQMEGLRGLVPLGRLGQPEEIAAAVVGLLGAPWTTGSELVVDGGLSL